MNCKPGDLAYIVAPFYAPARGRVVTVEERAGNPYHEVDGIIYIGPDPSWVVSCPSGVPLEKNTARTRLVIQDNCLRPIGGPSRDLHGEASKPATHELVE